MPDSAITRPRHACRGRLGRRAAARRRPMERTCPMKWNLRLAAANRGIWKASELQRLLAEALVISAGKMSACGPASRTRSSSTSWTSSARYSAAGSVNCCCPSQWPRRRPQPANSAGAVARSSRRHAQVPDRPVPATPVTGDQSGWQPNRCGFRVVRPDVTRPAQHVTPGMLIQRCDTPLLLAATRCAIALGRGPRLVRRDHHWRVLRPESRPGRPHRRRPGPAIAGPPAGAATQPQLSHQDR